MRMGSAANQWNWAAVPAVMIMIAGAAYADIATDFADPPRSSNALAWYWLDASIANPESDRQLQGLRDSSLYAGITPCFASDNWWNTPGFLDRFHHMVDKCAELDMEVCLCDDYFFPSGSARYSMGQFPDAAARAVVKTEEDVTGPRLYRKAIPQGTLMGCVAMNNGDHSRLTDIAGAVSDGTLSWDVPDGSWKIMIFTCVQSSYDFVNYLDPDAVRTWIGQTYQKFNDAMPEHYGSTITSEFFDDIAYRHAGSGVQGLGSEDYPAAWTDEFNEKFEAKYGFNPVKYYPAMWYDIGAETAAARNLLFGFRNELLSVGFGKTVAQWCADHGIEISGHYEGTADARNWIRSIGDPFLFFKHVHRVGTEGWRAPWFNMRSGYKIQGSVAFVYDKPLVVNQNYALVENFTRNDLYRMGMESFVRGVNLQYADGVQYDPGRGEWPQPELSWRDPQNGPLMPEWNRWAGRCHMLLQGGRHVADIALLFPIAAYTADCCFGHVNTTGDDHLEICEHLTNDIRRDFTFMHPEVLDSSCTIDAVNRTINLNNQTNWERYKVLIIPSSCVSRAIHASTLRKAREFYDNGGIVIGTSRLPTKSAELGQDAEVVSLVNSIFGLDRANPGVTYKKNTNAAGGKAYFIQNTGENVNGTDRLTWVLNDALAVWDVEFDPNLSVSGGPLSYLHKVLNGVDYYYFANSSDNTVNTQVRLRGEITPQIMDPHTGTITAATYQHVTESGQDVTVVTLRIDPVKSVFIGNDTPATVGFGGPADRMSHEGRIGVFLRTRPGVTIRIGSVPACAAGHDLAIELFGMNGRLVRVFDVRASDSRTVVVDPGDGSLARGAYLCRVRAPRSEKTVTFTVVK